MRIEEYPGRAGGNAWHDVSGRLEEIGSDALVGGWEGFISEWKIIVSSTEVERRQSVWAQTQVGGKG